MKFHILCFCLFVGSAIAQADSELEDYFQNYDEMYDTDFLKEEGEKLDRQIDQLHKELDDLDIHKTLEEIKHSLEENDKDLKIDEYQFEDTKEEVKEEKVSEEHEPSISKLLDDIETLAKDSDEKESKKTDGEKEKVEQSKEANEDYSLLWPDDVAAPLPPPIADDKAIFDETQEILNEDDDVNDFAEETKDISIPTNDQSNLEEILDETKKILADNENDFDTPNTSSEKADEDNSAKEEFESEEDSVDKINQDLDEDLKKLFETLDKLSDNNSEEAQDTEEVNSSSVLDYEEKYGKPYHEGLLLSQRADDNDYEEIESNLSEIFEKHRDTSEVIDSGDEEKNEPNGDDDINESTETKSNEAKQTTTILYRDDALVDEEQRVSSDEVEEIFKGAVETRQESQDTLVKDDKLESTTEASVTEAARQVRTKMVEDLSSAEFDDLMNQFTIFHREDLDVHAASFNRDTAPVHITLKVDEPTVITSPNYPQVYPSNNIVDWILEGDGVGIEMNVTDFAVNGALGEYVLVKPGGVDETGHEGIIFSYRLNSERRYRFTDVDRLFMRFESKPGMSLRGFSMSFRMISQRPEDPEDAPEPEAVLNPPMETLTVNLAGVNAIKFKEIREEFRQLVADMATSYIYDNKIDPGMNTTFEVTQITNQALCNIHWPGHEECVEVTFGIPLSYEEDMDYRLNSEDLEDMWRSAMSTEEFKRRLMLLGVEEFITPDDRSVMTVWLVIAAGVVISMAMLAFALWRFSCFDDYTRMQAFSDTDSIKNQKRDLDLYPTPHQTLPPLYSENEYKWPDHKFEDSARVDMSGFANRAYTRDDLYDFDSDEDVIPSRDRNNTVTSRDIFSDV